MPHYRREFFFLPGQDTTIQLLLLTKYTTDNFYNLACTAPIFLDGSNCYDTLDNRTHTQITQLEHRTPLSLFLYPILPVGHFFRTETNRCRCPSRRCPGPTTAQSICREHARKTKNRNITIRRWHRRTHFSKNMNCAIQPSEIYCVQPRNWLCNGK
jgi:hypothetical protein